MRDKCFHCAIYTTIFVFIGTLPDEMGFRMGSRQTRMWGFMNWSISRSRWCLYVHLHTFFLHQGF